MIYPRLHESGAVDIDNNGIGFLSDATDCTVTEERNGAFTLSITYPVGGVHWLDIDIGRVIYAKPNSAKREQPFVIKKVSKPMSGSVKIDAEHISYQTANIVLPNFACGNTAMFRNKINENFRLIQGAAVATFQFVFDTDIVAYALYHGNAWSPPRTYKSLLYDTGKDKESFLSLYGGEMECDRLSIYAHAARGADHGVTISYGKNLLALTQTRTVRDFATAVYPYYYKKTDDASAYVELPERVLHNGAAEYSDVEKTISLDLTKEFKDAEPSHAQLRQAAADWINANWQVAPPCTLSLSFVELGKTTEYANIAAAEAVNLCDTITVVNEEMGITAKLKVVKTVYDVLRDRYKSIDVGDPLTTLADTILKITGG